MTKFDDIPNVQSPLVKKAIGLISDKNLVSVNQNQRIIVQGTGEVKELNKYVIISHALQTSTGYIVVGIAKPESISSLASLPNVVRILPDVPLDLWTSSTQNSQEVNIIPTTEIIGASKAKNRFNTDGSNVTIAIVDSGVDFAVPDLTQAIARDFRNKPLQLDADGQGIVLTNVTFAGNITSIGTIANWTLTGFDATSNIYVSQSGVYLNITRSGLPLEIPVYNPLYPYYEPLVFKAVTEWNWRIGDNATHFIKSKSGIYHFGFISEYVAPYVFDIPSLVVDSSTPLQYDTVYVDLSTSYQYYLYNISNGTASFSPDYSFYDEKPHRIGDGSEILAEDYSGDGIPDFSAGLLGARVLDPWGSISKEKSNIDFNLGAVNGTLLSPLDLQGNYFGLMYDTLSHGTLVSVSAAGRGETRYDLYANGTYYNLPGVAPKASIMAVKALWLGDVLYGWMWASGFDLNIDTNLWRYSGLHKADIVSNSWGISSWPLLRATSGLDILSLLEDSLTLPSYLSPDYPGTLYVHASGNDGPGYGTTSLPGCSSFALTVGASTSNHFITAGITKNEPRWGGLSSAYDDIAYFSAKGPNPLGEAKPDLLNIGAFTFSLAPLNLGLGNGSLAHQIFGGTSLAAPLTAGAAALVIQTLKNQGEEITPFKIKSVLMNTADDLGNDPFSQGVGRTNAYEAVSSVVNKNLRVYTNTTYLNLLPTLNSALNACKLQPTGNLLNEFPSKPQPEGRWFAGNILADESSAASFVLENPSGRTVDVSVSAYTFELIKEDNYSSRSNPFRHDLLLGSEGGYRPIYIDLEDYFGIIPSDASLMLVTLHYPFEVFYNSTVSSLYADSLSILSLYVYDWKDVNGDNEVWYNETSLINRASAFGNVQELRISNPNTKFQGRAIIGIYSDPQYYSYWTGGKNLNVTSIEFNVTVNYYKKIPWNWIFFPQTIMLPANSSTIFDSKIKVPVNASPGVYQGFLTLNASSEHLINIPISFTVPIEITNKSLPFVFGMVRTAPERLYDNGAIFGAIDISGRYSTGDWRLFKFTVLDNDVNSAIIRLHWSSQRTSIDLFVIDPKGKLIATSVPPGVFLDLSQWVSNDWLGSTYWPNLGTYVSGGFYPSQNAGPNVTVLQVPINGTGLYTVLLHNTIISGSEEYETFSGEISISNLMWDEKPPNLIIDMPPSYVKEDFSLLFHATDDNLLAVKYSIDGGPTKDAQGLKEIKINTNLLHDGYHTITIKASDRVGHEVSQTIILNVDNTLPIVRFTAPQNKSVVKGNVVLKFDLLDSNLNSATLRILNNSSDVIGNDTFTWDTSKVGDGSYILNLTATDMAGHTSRADLPIVVDNTCPFVLIVSPENESVVNGTTPIVFKALDTNLKQVTLSFDGFLINVTGNTQYIWDTTSLGDGSHNVTLTASDEAGNTASTTIRAQTSNVGNLINKVQVASYTQGQFIGLGIGLLIGVILVATVSVFLFRKYFIHK